VRRYYGAFSLGAGGNEAMRIDANLSITFRLDTYNVTKNKTVQAAPHEIPPKTTSHDFGAEDFVHHGQAVRPAA
jgi:hypothetical protein